MITALRAPGVRAAALTLLYLGGSVVLSFPASSLATDVGARFGVRATPALLIGALLLCCGLGGLLWGRHLAGAFGPRGRGWRMGAAAGLGFGLSAAAALRTLTGAEAMLLERELRGEPTMPMHLAFGLTFGLATFEVVAGTTLALLLAAGWRAAALPRALRIAIAGAAVFVAISAVMDFLGWRVGAPNAEARFTMVVVTALALVLATLTAGALLGRTLARAAR